MTARSLVVCPLNPWPVTSGARQRINLLAECLSELGPVDVFHFRGSNAFEPQQVPAWVDRTGSVDKPVPSAAGRTGVIAAACRAYARGLPREFGVGRDRRAAAAAAFDRFVDGRHYKVVLVVRQQTLVLINHLQHVNRDVAVIDVDDLEDDKLRQRRRRLLQTGVRHVPAAALMSVDAAWWRRLHRRVGTSNAVALVCADADARQLLRLGVEAAVVPNAFSPVDDALPDPPQTHHGDAVFVGSPRYRPNRDAVALLRECIVPAVRAQDAGFQLHVAGGCDGPPQDGITYHGFVDDLGALLRPGRLAVLPILEQSGMSIKVLDSARRGATIITTAMAARGLGFVSGRHYLAARTADEFVSAVRHVRTHPDHAGEIARNARTHVLDHYAPEAVRSRFLAVLQGRALWLSGPSSEHTQQSTIDRRPQHWVRS